jgi:hypothetical protein
MDQLNKSNLTLDFEIGFFNDHSMSMIIDGKTFDSFDNPNFVYTKQIELPTAVCIEVRGKGKNDTLVDSNGQVVKDKYILLKNIQLDGVSCAPFYCHKAIILDTGTDKIKSPYWGFNGFVQIDFDESNGFRWLIKTQHLATAQ